MSRDDDSYVECAPAPAAAAAPAAGSRAVAGAPAAAAGSGAVAGPPAAAAAGLAAAVAAPPAAAPPRDGVSVDFVFGRGASRPPEFFYHLSREEQASRKITGGERCCGCLGGLFKRKPPGAGVPAAASGAAVAGAPAAAAPAAASRYTEGSGLLGAAAGEAAAAGGGTYGTGEAHQEGGNTLRGSFCRTQ